jgi:23S rRNA (cytosine1962-C5)-methyltransferase
MMREHTLVSLPWKDYELLDSGENMKLERFGDIIVARPETQALWAKQRPELWNTSHAVFSFSDKKGQWDVHKPVPESWKLAFGDTHFLARLSSFKHTGIFPEQAPNWEWSRERITSICEREELARKQSGLPSATRTGDPRTFSQQVAGPSILNLFGYTGIASLVAAQAGAFVTHVDASKQSLDWAHENARASGIPEDSIRWMLDDALAFAKREARRGAQYDGIILDPPAFGRGAKGEVWHIEEDLPALLTTLKELLSTKPGSFFLLNGYAAGYAPRAFAQAVKSAFGETQGAYGEIHIKESANDRAIPAGIYVRFTV